MADTVNQLRVFVGPTEQVENIGLYPIAEGQMFLAVDTDTVYRDIDGERVPLGTGTSIITEADWAENNEKSSSYVKNRTHWKETNDGIIIYHKLDPKYLPTDFYFTSLEAASNAAQVAANSPYDPGNNYYIGQMLLVYENGVATWYYILPNRSLCEIGKATSVDVEVVDKMEEGNMKPITSNAVYNVVGDIETILKKI